jgi:nucleoside-diphosphate kinase
MASVEKTLVLFKPDTVQRGLVGEILTRFERVGLKIVGTKMIFPDKDHYYKHYEDIGQMVTRRGEKAFNVTLEMMQTGPVIAMVFEGVEAVGLVRKMVGGTEPKSALPGTIRGDYSHMSFEYADGRLVSREWMNIWLIFAAYALVIGILFALVFKYKHQQESKTN